MKKPPTKRYTSRPRKGGKRKKKIKTSTKLGQMLISSMKEVRKFIDDDKFVELDCD